MPNINYIAIEKTHCFTNERAQAFFEEVEAHKGDDSIFGHQPDTSISSYVVGADVIDISFGVVNIESLEYYFRAERQYSEAGRKMLGLRALTPGRNGYDAHLTDFDDEEDDE